MGRKGIRGKGERGERVREGKEDRMRNRGGGEI